MFSQTSSIPRKIAILTICIVALFANLTVTGIGTAAAEDQVPLEGCVFTQELLDGQGFSLSGLGFSLSGLGFSLSGLGFSLSGLGFSLSGLGVTPDQVVDEILDENNRVDGQWLIDRLQDIQGGHGFNKTPTAIVIVDDFNGDPYNHGDPNPMDPHGKKVKDVTNMLINQLGMGALSNPNIIVVPLDVSGPGVDYQADAMKGLVEAKVNDLVSHGYKHIVLNFSLGVLPCKSNMTLSDGTQVNFNFHEAVQAVHETMQPHHVVNILECVSQYGDDQLMAHFGYNNPNGSPVVIPPGSDNHLSGGGLSDAVLEAKTPTYFARPNVVEGEPGRSDHFPNSAFQVIFDKHKPLTWTLFGNSITASKDSERCVIPEGYGLTQYFGEAYGLKPPQVGELLNHLFDQVDSSPENPLADLEQLLHDFLERSATDPHFKLIPVAASGNFRFLYPRNNPENTSEPLPSAPPLSPASMPETVAVSALLGNVTNPPSNPVSQYNRDILWRFSHDGNVAVPGGTIALGENYLLVGTSFAAPFDSVLTALWLTYKDACDFEAGSGRPPLNLNSAGDFVNALYSDSSIDYPLNCERPLAIEVGIDIKPGNADNVINLGSDGVVDVAILGSHDFNVYFVNPSTVTLAGGPIRTIGGHHNVLDYSFKDVNYDGFKDLVAKIDTETMTLSEDMTQAELLGELYDGTPIHGVDSVRVVPLGSPYLWWPLNGSKTRANFVTLKWYPVTAHTCYRIQVDDSQDFSSPVQDATVVSFTQYTTAWLNKGTYYWRVQVGGNCNVTSGPWSDTWSFTIR